MNNPNPPPLSPQSVAGELLGIATLWIAVLALHLTPAVFAALITYSGTRALAARLQLQWPAMRHVQAWSLSLLLAATVAVSAIVIERTSEATATGSGFAGLLQQMASALEQLRAVLPLWLSTHLPVSLESLREAAVGWLRSHASELQLWGGHTVRGFGYALAGIIIGGLAALQLPVQSPPTDTPMASAIRREFNALVYSFTSVVFAQLRIAAINTALTAVYILGILPMLGKSLPLSGTLMLATFVASLVPVIGNLVSNTMIVVVSLTQSVAVAGLSLAWLVGIHKLEYFLNAHIIGQRIRAQAWELLIAMLAMEAMFGLAGLVSAPVLYAQLKNTLYTRGWL